MRITTRHSIDIDAPPEAVYAFFEGLEENYTKWHPDHISFRWAQENGLEEGAIAYAAQRVHGKIHKTPARFTRVEPNRRIEFVWANPFLRFFAPLNVWIFEPIDGGCRFTAEGVVRLGWISSRMKHVQRVLEEGRRHIAEEGENLKRLVEAGEVSAPKPRGEM